ncbi:MAG: phosphate acyltransferase PlsX [Clostridia bacterium]|nr:phosphate acyltransferase PlsX [Clostridia bacterium]
MITIALDAMGGDVGPAVTVPGAVLAVERDPELAVDLYGEEAAVGEALRRALEGARAPLRGDPAWAGRLRLVPCRETIATDEPPTRALREKADASIVRGLRAVAAGEAHAFVSAGNTGALMAGSLLFWGHLAGARRPALVQVVPSLDGPGTVFLDMGAHMNATWDELVEWAVMGSAYAERVLRRPNPRVALLSVGAEAGKGTDAVRRAHRALERSGLNFVGNVEGRDLLRGTADVVVADGFVGNVALKAMEGAVSELLRGLRRELSSSFRARLGALLALPAFRRLKERFDAHEFGGAPLLGVAGVCVKCHGNSTERAIAAGIRVAALAVRQDLVGTVAQSLVTVERARARAGEGGR